MPAAVLFAGSVGPTNVPPAFVRLQTLGAAGPSLVAILLAGRLYGKEELKELLGRFKVWRVGWRWYLGSILLLAPSIAAASVAKHALLAVAQGEVFPCHPAPP